MNITTGFSPYARDVNQGGVSLTSKFVHEIFRAILLSEQ